MIKIFGHRGCKDANNSPENSLAAFESAIAQGADGIELDVYSSQDGHLVVFHDTTVEKLTDGSGKLSLKSLAEIKKLRLKKPHSQELSDQAIPTLDEVFDLVKAKAKPNFVINIEMKGGIATPLADAIRKRLIKNWSRENFLVSSFDFNGLQDFNKELPAISIGALLGGNSSPWNISENMLHKRLLTMTDLHPATINLTLPSMIPATIEMIRQHHAQPVAWTVNEAPPSQLSPEMRAHASNFLAHGYAIITDYPAEMRALIPTQ